MLKIFTKSQLSYLWLTVFWCFVLSSQETTKEFPKTLYVLSQQGDITRYDEKTDMFLETEERELFDEEDRLRVDTIFIKKRLNDSNYIVTRTHMDRMALMHRSTLVKDSIYRLGPIFEGLTVEELEEKYENEQIPLYTKLFSRMFFTQKKLAALSNAPGLDEITREDLIASLQWRQEIGEAIKSFVEQDADVRPYRLRRMVENYRNQKLVLLGYNPYKQVVFNWEKQFAGDEEVIFLLTEPISFD